MPESEVQLYMAYVEKKPLPFRALEIQLAQVSQNIVNMASDKNKFAIGDFLLFDERKEQEPISERDFAIAMGFKVD